MVKMISDVYVPIEYLELRVSRQDLIWRSFRDGRREGTCVVPRYQATSFMLIRNCFVVNIPSHNIKFTWVGRKQRTATKAEYK